MPRPVNAAPPHTPPTRSEASVAVAAPPLPSNNGIARRERAAGGPSLRNEAASGASRPATTAERDVHVGGDGERAERTEPAPSRRQGDPLELPVLVVNRYFQPVQVTPARRAFLLLYGGAAMAIDEVGDLHDFSAWRALPVRAPDDDELPVIGGALRVPRVLHLRRYERMRRPTIRLTRKNLMLRDAHQCQYCSRRPPVRDLNIDHVLPRSRGGQDSWENLVTACRGCNLHKGWRTPDEASMRLIRTPVTPRWSTTMQILMGLPRPFKEWDPFLKAG